MECADVVCVRVCYVAIISEAQHKTPIALWERTNAHTHIHHNIINQMLKTVANT